MNVYMLEDAKTGKFYRRRGSGEICWVEQKDASIWTSSPTQALMYVSRMKRKPVIRIFKLEPTDD